MTVEQADKRNSGTQRTQACSFLTYHVNDVKSKQYFLEVNAQPIQLPVIMSTITSIYPKTNISSSVSESSKVAEIHRADSGRIFYICFHCGLSLDNIADTLTHIDFHFNLLQNIKVDEDEVEDPLDFIVIKHELHDDDSKEVVESSQLEQLFVDHLNSIDDKRDVGMDTNDMGQQTSSSAMENNSTFRMRLIKDRISDVQESKVHRLMDQDLKIEGSNIHGSVVQGSNIQRLQVQRSKDEVSVVQRSKVQGSLVQGSKFHILKVQAPKLQESKVKNKQFCTLCPQSLIGTVNFMQHTFMHYDLKPFICPECSKKFCRKSTLDDHLNKKHSLKVEYNFQCRFCDDDKAGNVPEFVTHAFTYHLDEGDINSSDLNSNFTYDCQFCFKNFTQWNDLHSHVKIHKDDELPKVFTLHRTAPNGRSFSERAKKALYRSESLYNCSSCMKTLCGSFEARNHWISEHNTLKKTEIRKIVIKEDELAGGIVHKIMQEGSFKCYDCDEVAKSRLCFMKHRLKHFNIRPYPCTLCSKSFHSSAAAVRHSKLSHNINPATIGSNCHYCKANFTEEIDFISHMFDKHLYENFNEDQSLDDKCQYECVYCKEIIRKQNMMIQHLQIHENEKTPEMKPVTDTETGTTSVEATMNALRHKVEYLYCCLDCPQKFRLPYLASEHQKVKHKSECDDRRKKSKESTTCDVCNTTFYTWRSMVNHRGKQHPETNNPNGWKKKDGTVTKKNKAPTTRDTNCNICKKSFPTWRSMLNHKANRHPETHKPDKYKDRPVCYCPTCGKTFRDRGYLIKHERTHLQPRPYTCDICKKQYSLKITLQTHMLTHSKQKNFICELCGKSFVSVSKLNLHNQVHENLTLKCDLCDKVFLTRNNFSKHKRTHENHTRKKCKLCDKTFKSALSLRIHTLLHTGEKKYSCRYCSLTFAQSSGRRGHERTKHEKID